MIAVVMGVAGCGKTLIGRSVAARLGWTFYDADDFHPEANVEKMRAGIALADADRDQWLARLAALLADLDARGERAVLACSALRHAYRTRLAGSASGVLFVFLKGTYELFEERLRQRTNHFFGFELLRSQFDLLEEPEEAIVVDASQTVDAVTTQIAAAIEQLEQKPSEGRQ
ncbi:MAG TPA: gluconokinase [Thermoanaerobaculia bacterium]|nr:gluconokinase [Thermoanaerobaculia bacterium]